MKKEEINTKLKKVLCQIGVDTDNRQYDDIISNFRNKLEILFDSDRYTKLWEQLFPKKKMDGINFNSRAFEVAFAYDFESKGHKLNYEVKQLSGTQSSVDFCYKLNDEKKIYFELCLKNQSEWVTNKIRTQLKTKDDYEILFNGEKQRDEIARLLNAILAKCQDKKGNPLKFCKKRGVYNIVVVYVTELLLGSTDKHDCRLAMCGNPSVAEQYRLGIFGLCQQLPQNAPNKIKEHYDRYKHFRETIHGVLFAKHKNGKSDRPYINLDLEYLLIPNKNLLQRQEFNLIEGKLGAFLKGWTQNDHVKSKINKIFIVKLLLKLPFTKTAYSKIILSKCLLKLLICKRGSK